MAYCLLPVLLILAVSAGECAADCSTLLLHAEQCPALLQVNSCSLPQTDSPLKVPECPSPASALEVCSYSGTRERSSSLQATLTSLCRTALPGAAARSLSNLPTTLFTQGSTNVSLSSLTVPKPLPDSISLSSVSQILTQRCRIGYTLVLA